MKQDKTMRKSRLRSFWSCVLAFSLIFAVIANSKTSAYASFVNDHGINPKVSTQADRNASATASNEFTIKVESEGIVLMKNEGGLLPLAKGTDVSLFGKNSHNIIYGAAGTATGGTHYGQRFLSWYGRTMSGTESTGSNESKDVIADGGELTKAGLNVNKELSDYYSTYARSGASKNKLVGANDPAKDLSTREPNLEDFLKDTAAVASFDTKYNDVAIMTISRLGGEGSDMPRQLTNTGTTANVANGTAISSLLGPPVTADTGGAQKTYGNSNWAVGDKYHHALEPELQEIDMVEYIKKPKSEGGAGFSKLILLINTGTPMELDSLTQYADAVLWIGFPGATGLTAVAKTLVGDINPSGRFVDTWARDLMKTPSVQDFGSNLRINDTKDGLANGAVRYTNADGTGNPGAAGVRYQEDIYIGYRYYETRGYTEQQAVLGKTPTATLEEQMAWYNNEVAYPFGFGLSYTNFSWNFQGVNPANNSGIDRKSVV